MKREGEARPGASHLTITTGSKSRPEPESSEGSTPLAAKPGDAPCSSCGERLGGAMVRRGQTVHVPECTKMVAA